MNESWTTKRPIEEGWYWASSDDTHSDSEIVLIRKLDDGSLWIYDSSVNEDYPLSDYKYWSGRLNFPVGLTG